MLPSALASVVAVNPRLLGLRGLCSFRPEIKGVFFVRVGCWHMLTAGKEENESEGEHLGLKV